MPGRTFYPRTCLFLSWNMSDLSCDFSIANFLSTFRLPYRCGELDEGIGSKIFDFEDNAENFLLENLCYRDDLNVNYSCR